MSSSSAVDLQRFAAAQAQLSSPAAVTVSDGGLIQWRCACGRECAEMDDHCLRCNAGKSEAVLRGLAAARAALGVGVESNASFSAGVIEAASAAARRAVEDEASEDDDATTSTSDEEPAEAEQELKCVHCQKIYESVSKRKKHERDYHGPQRQCPECQYSTSNKSALKRHIDSVHNNIPRVRAKKRCAHCNKMIRTGDYSVHVRTHTGEKPYACPYCLPAAYKEAAHLTNHIDSYHRARHPIR